MARDKALYDGHAVAAVAATSHAIAEEALELIDVDYEVLPHVHRRRGGDGGRRADPARAHLHRGRRPRPTSRSNIAEAPRIREGRRRAGLRRGGDRRRAPLHHPAPCTRAISSRTPAWPPSAPTARRRSGVRARASSWCARYCANVLGLEIANIRVTPAEIGGGFGGKTTVYLEPLALALSRSRRRAGEDGDDPRRGVPRHRTRPPAGSSR